MRIIQVGLGGMGNAWLRTVQASNEVEYAGFVEVNDAITAVQADEYSLDRCLIFRSLPEALDAAPADGVLIVAPPQFHRELSLIALEAGVPVLSEKPLADTMKAAWDVVRKANETGVLHMVTQQRRYTPMAQTLKRLIQSGELGPVGAVTLNFFRGPHFGGFREEMPYPLIIDMSIHYFDMMRFFLEADPVAITGHSWNPPWSWYKGDASATVLLEFLAGTMVSYNGSWCSQALETSWEGNWRFDCHEGVIALQDERVYTQRTGQEIVEVELVQMEHTGQAYLLHEFHEAVTTGKKPGTTCQDNIKSLAIVFDTIKSFETGATVYCDGLLDRISDIEMA